MPNQPKTYMGGGKSIRADETTLETRWNVSQGNAMDAEEKSAAEDYGTRRKRIQREKRQELFPYRHVQVGSFDPASHFYPRVLNAQIHPIVRYFRSLSLEQIVHRHCHLHPGIDSAYLLQLMSTPTKYFRWGGCDLMHVTNASGNKHTVVIETNSCPSGQKSAPLLNEDEEDAGYRAALERSFVESVRNLDPNLVPGGKLAVIYDKNLMEASGYAAALADLMQEEVILAPFLELKEADACPQARFLDGILQVRAPQEKGWIPVRAAFRYVTQKPWNRIPLETKTLVFNPLVCCLAGGRNKAVAAKAYDNFNVELKASGLEVRTPLTIRDVTFEDIPSWVQRLGGFACIKIPYSNAGQGVYTITSKSELNAFVKEQQDCPYEKFVVQSLIGNADWSSSLETGEKLYHVGTMPDKKGKTFVADLRVMVCSGEGGFRVCSMYARRAREALRPLISDDIDSWDMLGTNLSVKIDDHSFTTEPERLLLMDRRDFNFLGMGIDDIIDAFVQTALAVVAIDRMCIYLMADQKDGVGVPTFDHDKFRSVNDDNGLLFEMSSA